MYVYIYDRHHCREREETHRTIKELIARAAVEISYNLAMPVQIEDEHGAVVMAHDELNEKAWNYIESHDI